MQKLLDFEHPIINEKGADRDVSAARPERQNNTVNKVVCLVIFKHRAPDQFPGRAPLRGLFCICHAFISAWLCSPL
jgi:hypothetical protein